jgi:CubicO group peptidase (beta-lactamase class C family)
MSGLEESVDRIAAETGFSGVVRVDRGDDVQLVKVYGLAHRGCYIANAVDTQFGIASGTKGLTALAVVSLIEEGRLKPTTPARSVLGEDLPLIDDQVTVEQLLAHRSGIGDYMDEEAGHPVTDHVLAVPAHALAPIEVPAGARRTPEQVPTGRTVLLQQQRLRRARTDRGPLHRHTVS